MVSTVFGFESDTQKNDKAICASDSLSGCSICAERLCLRQKTINLALGYTEMMYCLNCLEDKEGSTANEILAKTKKYVLARECFAKEWVKYKNISYCPKPNECFPGTCFD